MILAQIYAVIALLAAFGVGQPTLDIVQSILISSQHQQQSIGEVGGPVLSPQIQQTVVTSCTEPFIITKPSEVIQNSDNRSNGVIEYLWFYSPCPIEKAVVRVHSGAFTEEQEYHVNLNGSPESGPYKGLNSFVAIRVLLYGSPYTLTVYSPNGGATTTFTGSY